jgi:hypothetical protein
MNLGEWRRGEAHMRRGEAHMTHNLSKSAKLHLIGRYIFFFRKRERLCEGELLG